MGVNKIKELFLTNSNSSDDIDKSTITLDDFNRLIADNEIVAYFKALDIDATEAKGLFELLDADGSGDVALEEFVTGCLRLKGEATAVDVVTLIHENKKLAQFVLDFKHAMDDCFESMSARMDSVRG